MYQLDIPIPDLESASSAVVEECVSLVGLDVNSAPLHLLKSISGLGRSRAAAIISHRETTGPFMSRQQLLEVCFFFHARGKNGIEVSFIFSHLCVIETIYSMFCHQIHSGVSLSVLFFSIPPFCIFCPFYYMPYIIFNRLKELAQKLFSNARDSCGFDPLLPQSLERILMMSK